MDGLVRIRSLSGFNDCVKAMGGDPWSMLCSLGIDEERLADPEAWIPFGVTLRAFEVASRALAEPAFGVKLSRFRGLSYLGPLLLIARHAPDLATALACIGRYFRIQNTAVRIMMQSDGEGVIRSYHMPSNLRRSADQWIEESLTTSPLLLQRISGKEFPVMRFMMRHRPNRPVPEYRAQFGAEVLFEQPFDGMEFPRELLTCPVPNHDLDVYNFLDQHLESRVASTGVDIEGATRRLLEMLVPCGQARIDVVSGHLGMHPRTLQRQLGRLGYTFSGMLEDQKRNIAERLLAKGDLSLVDIAAHLGYAEQSAFNHAFTRWHGISPSQWLQRTSTART